MSTTFDVADALTGICRLVVDTVPSAEHASITVDGEVVASTGDPAGPGATVLALPSTDGTTAALVVNGHGHDLGDGAALDTHVTVASALVHAAGVIGQLDRALASRATIEQAKGILMATHRVTDSEAFRMLVDHSQTTNRKLHLVAEEFVASASN